MDGQILELQADDQAEDEPERGNNESRKQQIPAADLIAEHFDRIGWAINPVTKTDVFWRADGAASREVLAALVAFRERSQGG